MGTFNVNIEVSDPEGRRYDRVEALVDTGSTYLSLPRPLLEALGVVPYTSDRFVFADGRQVEREIGHARITVGGREVITLVVFADPGSPALLGAYALEGLRLAPDPVGRRLVPVPGLIMPLVPIPA
jgi:clan AA aspartic protease